MLGQMHLSVVVGFSFADVCFYRESSVML